MKMSFETIVSFNTRQTRKETSRKSRFREKYSNIPKFKFSNAQISSLLYNIIPNFDFTENLNNMFGNSDNMSDATIKCDENLSCIGFNSSYYLKKNSKAIISNSSLYVHAVTFGVTSVFRQINGWDSVGADVAGSPITVTTASECAFQCTITIGCVGLVWDGNGQCWLKQSYGPPFLNSSRNILIPIRISSCPKNDSENNCIVPEPTSDIVTVCNILIEWNIYDEPNQCWQSVMNGDNDRINFDEQFYVTSIVLNSLNILGTLPSTIASFARLTSLDLSSNKFCDTIPTELGLLTLLNTLKLYDNQLHGSIPTELGQLTLLKLLRLSVNNLVGSIPTELGLLNQLQYLNFRSNSLTGIIPTELGTITSLESLFLYNNQLSGSLPSSIGKLSKLKIFYVFDNNLFGSIPTQLGLLANLQDLQLYNNQLTASLPTELGQLTLLYLIDLNVNHLSGTIPTELG